MKALVKHVPTFLRDSSHTIEDLKLLGPLPDYARLFTADAVSMYTNIHCEEGCAAFQGWFDDYAAELPRNFPVALFMAVLKIVMTYNIFQFDNTYWLQLSGTAMGTSCACLYATIFWGYIERKKILPKWKPLLPYLKRFIDDKLGIWIGSDSEFESFKADLNTHGSLSWITSCLQTSVDFLDLTISLDDNGGLRFKTYQKAFNLYLYIPPSSAHPPGVLKSIIFGNLRRYWQQNTSLQDYVAIARQFAERLEARGHARSTIDELFMDALYATIFWGYIERKRILPKWKHLLPFFKRFIDDKLGIWVGSTLEFEQFMIDLNSQGSLQWIASGLQSSVNFLDLTISFCQDNKLSFMTYQKAFNLYLYIPPSSAHPPGVLKSIIYGNLRRYWQQNTSIDDYIAIARQFADRLEARGHKRSTITELFLEATKAFTKTAPTKSTTAESPLYLHWEWH
eukprot:CAMPEP_0172434678 /NCGR_PEP_ID=MMETSP1064-20121228/70754_1 /TAXON_ID=202472 /ORGANISM="Aulacoseira subarctica , Strain CCAP 1002/5" /LENGTH=451 /DNA_ID=CAMNT_0013182913 /DNA_START=373 /DNA_END=1724 /DNA_ORIENTATION=+